MGLDVEMLSVVLGEGACSATVAAALGVHCLCISAYCKTNADIVFAFCLSFP